MIQFPLPPPDPRVLNAWDMRRLFNEGNYLNIIRADIFNPITLRCKSVQPPYIGKETPRGSISHVLNFRDANDETVILIQRYIKPDGGLGGTGRKNEPKALVIDGVTFRPALKGEPCEDRLRNKDINELLKKTGLAALTTYAYGAWDKTGPFRFWFWDNYRRLRNLPRYSRTLL